MVSDEVQELFFSLWQVAHELERRGCLARVFEFEPLETRLDALDRIAEESLWENVSLPRLFVLLNRGASEHNGELARLTSRSQVLLPITLFHGA